MLQAKLNSNPAPQSNANKVKSIRSTKRAIQADQQEQNFVVVASKRYKVRLSKEELPLTVTYGESTYVIVVTKSDKLLLQDHVK